ncbi:hypothetical protein BYT27DRAFT_7250228 [Phlegmacium glaucopus]|nr:hypothetical protein BYT27DRAFT_7250228 [Phlegmacium glaucopus]
MFSPNYSRGSATRSLACYEAYKSSYFSALEKEILCDRPCAALPNAGKKGRRRAAEDEPIIGEEYGGLHECDLLLHVVIRLLLMCHGDSVSCPPCPFLATMLCACDEKSVPNVRCSLETEKVSCGTVCGRLMACRFHHCERLCHSDECGNCTAPYGKARKYCLPDHHPCTRTCHAPSSCPETEPCESLITLSVPAVGSVNPFYAAKLSLNIAKQNARLADALGITLEGTKSSAAMAVTYADELSGFARVNPKFLSLVERTFADFITSEKRTNVLPHMPPDSRKFVHDRTQMLDQEPHRSVQGIRRIETRIPTPLLSTFIAPAPGLGKLADFRALKATTPSTTSWRSTAATSTSSHPLHPQSEAGRL